ncbi:MAG: two-component system response regulator [Pedosphaera sp.]|nr:two-component system response regulator [Pedosphaera sp.]
MKANETVLHVDDDSNDVMLVEMAFRKAKVGVHLKATHDGDQAIDYLSGNGFYTDRSHHPLPALLLLDLKLPRKSGLEVLAWLRSQPQPQLKRLPVVMLTSSNQLSDINAAYDLGANSYLVKPGDLSDLVELIKSLHHYWLGLNTNPSVEAAAARKHLNPEVLPNPLFPVDPNISI